MPIRFAARNYRLSVCYKDLRRYEKIARQAREKLLKNASMVYDRVVVSYKPGNPTRC